MINLEQLMEMRYRWRINGESMEKTLYVMTVSHEVRRKRRKGERELSNM